MTGDRKNSPSSHVRTLNHLSRQADEIINQGTNWVTLADKLDVARYSYSDGYPEWHDSAPFRPMFLSYLWAKVEGHPLSGIPDRLSDKPELARAFGFCPTELPSESTFKPTRLEDKRFRKLQSTVETAAEQIRKIAVERCAPIGYDIGHLRRGDGEDKKTTLSERTIDRLLRREGKKALRELEVTTFPAIPLPQPENAVYPKKGLLELEAAAAINRSAANDAGRELGDLKNPEPEPDDPFYKDGPTGETLLKSLKQMSVDEIATAMNFALKKTYIRAKPRLRELEKKNGARFSVRAKVALDITYVAYYGDREEMEWVQGAPDDKEYTWCHKFATVMIVGQNTHYVVGVCPVGSTEYADTDAYPGKDQSYYIGDVARQLLSIANEYVNIRMVYADREFHAADVIDALEEKGLKYVIPAVRNDRVRRKCDRFDSLKRGFTDDKKDEVLYVKKDFAMYGRVKHKVSNTRVTTNLVVLSPSEDDKVHNPKSPRPFLTNLDVNDEISLDRRRTKKQIEQYSDRAAIERSYPSIKECASWTTSKVFEVRWFHFGFACLVYNIWLLLDFLTQERIGMIETRRKPRISLSRFLGWLDKVLYTLI